MSENECPECHGQGWITDSDPESRSVRRCSCQLASSRFATEEFLGIPARFGGCSLENYKTSSSPSGEPDNRLEAKTRIQRYVDNFLINEAETGPKIAGLLLIGPPGVGKTHLAIAVLREIAKRYGKRGHFTDFTSLLMEIRGSFSADSDVTQSELLYPLLKADVLLLDDLGAANPTGWVTDVLYYVLNTRYGSGLPTLFTSNYRLEPVRSNVVSLDRDHRSNEDRREHRELLEHRISASVLSRILEMASPFVIESFDWRKEILSPGHSF